MDARDTALQSRVAVLETRVSGLEQEEQRTRGRLHDLESDRATLRLLVAQMKELAHQVENVATRAAERALASSFAEREERKERQLAHRLGILGSGVGAGGLLVAIVFHFL